MELPLGILHVCGEIVFWVALLFAVLSLAKRVVCLETEMGTANRALKAVKEGEICQWDDITELKEYTKDLRNRLRGLEDQA